MKSYRDENRYIYKVVPLGTLLFGVVRTRSQVRKIMFFFEPQGSEGDMQEKLDVYAKIQGWAEVPQ